MDFRGSAGTPVRTRAIFWAPRRYVRTRACSLPWRLPVHIRSLHDQSSEGVLSNILGTRTCFRYWGGRCLHSKHGLRGTVVPSAVWSGYRHRDNGQQSRRCHLPCLPGEGDPAYGLPWCHTLYSTPHGYSPSLVLLHDQGTIATRKVESECPVVRPIAFQEQRVCPVHAGKLAGHVSGRKATHVLCVHGEYCSTDAKLLMWGIWAPFDFISSFALNEGFKPDLALYLISIIKVCLIDGPPASFQAKASKTDFLCAPQRYLDPRSNRPLISEIELDTSM